MIARSVRRSRAARWAARLLVGAALSLPAPLAAQEPAPRDTARVPQDTAIVVIPPEQVAQDTLPRPEPPAAEDTLRPAPNLPVFPRAPATGFALARWEWGPEELARWHGMSILDLLERVPGLLVTRGGWYGRPAGIAAFGLGGGRVRVLLDGWEMDPLEAGVFDVQHLAIVDLETVRVERDLGEVRIELFTFRLENRRAFSQIEAGTALFRTRILRGLFAAPTGSRGTVTVGLDITDTDGWLGTQPYAGNGVLARYSYLLTETTGLQAELRQTSVERGAPFATDADRRDVVLRARSRPLPGLALDAHLGRSTWGPGDADTVRTPLASNQASLRARWDAGPAWIGGAARLRNSGRVGYPAPTLALSAEGGVRPVPWLDARGRATNARVGGIAGTELEGGVRVGPAAGFSLFAGAATGSRPLGLMRDTLLQREIPPATPDAEATVAIDTTWVFPTFASGMRAFRAGAEWTGWGARIGAAYLSHDVDSIAPFNLPFDRTLPAIATPGPVTGAEAFWSIPLLYGPLRLEGSATYWREWNTRPYLPELQARVGLTFNQLFYEGNLEPTLRVEGIRRTESLVPTADRTGFGAASPAYTVYNLLLQIRVLDVRAFLIWDNILNNQTVNDLVGPGRTQGGQRFIYGVRWHFLD